MVNTTYQNLTKQMIQEYILHNPTYIYIFRNQMVTWSSVAGEFACDRLRGKTWLYTCRWYRRPGFFSIDEPEIQHPGDASQRDDLLQRRRRCTMKPNRSGKSSKPSRIYPPRPIFWHSMLRLKLPGRENTAVDLR
jgi:hypothetical protein